MPPNKTNRDCGSPICSCVLPLFFELGRAIDSGKDIHEVMAVAVKLIVDNLAGTERVVLAILDRKTGTMYIENAWGLSEEERNRGIYRIGEGITGRVAETGEAVVVPSIAGEPEFLDRTRARRDRDTSRLAFICVPIKLGREVMGTLGVDCPNPGLSDLEEERELLTVVAGMLAQAVQLHRARDEENAELREENRRLHEELAERFAPDNIVGNSGPMRSLYKLVRKVADKTTPVLILGESGTGKELVASALHYGGRRAAAPFVRFNCAAIPESLAESEMFGHERGSFTGAVSRRIGRFEEANGGTLFMDEVGELSPTIQAKLLRVLQSREFERIGGGTVSVDVRIVAATNRDLAAMVKQGTFREDLYYRFNVFPVVLPPLRERGGDILLLADHFVEKYAKLHDTPVKRISTPAIDALMAYHWPGNVRELENVIERAVILSDDGVIHAYHLPPTLQTAETSGTRYRGSLEARLESVERELIVDALKGAGGNMAKASRELGLSERVIALRVEKYGIDFRLFRPKAN